MHSQYTHGLAAVTLAVARVVWLSKKARTVNPPALGAMFDRASHHDQRCLTDATYCSQILVVNARASKGVDCAATFLGDVKHYPLRSTE
jgi:hypothetical protein